MSPPSVTSQEVSSTFTLSLTCPKCECREAHVHIWFPAEIVEVEDGPPKLVLREGAAGNVEIECANPDCKRSVKFNNVAVAA